MRPNEKRKSTQLSINNYIPLIQVLCHGIQATDYILSQSNDGWFEWKEKQKKFPPASDNNFPPQCLSLLTD